MARCGLVGAIALFLSATTPQAAAAPKIRTSTWLAGELRAGHRVVLKKVTITGPLALDRLDSVSRIFECRECMFTGPLSAHNVVFERTVDLSGSTFRKVVDFTGARFRAPALFRAPLSDDESRRAKPKCAFKRGAVFSLAVFEDLVSFGRTRFCAETDFRDARFSDTTFSGSWFTTSTFARAAFRGAALFNDAHFDGHASFEEADFRLRADFARARMSDGGDFAETRFGDGASFLVADFSVRDADEAATFQDAVSSGDLNFTFATFEHEIATFSGLVSSGSLVLRDAEFDEVNGVTMDRLQVRDLVLNVDSVDGISGREQRIAVLKMIEESAKQRGDLSIANDAHYEMRSVRSEAYNDFWAPLDYVFYRGLAGYFVRPLRPLLALVALATLFAFFRLRARGPQSHTDVPAEPISRPRRLWHATVGGCARFLNCLLDTLAIALPHWGGRGRELGLHERLEVVVYRVLFVCVLIGLANSNPTLREMVDSLL